MLVHSGLTRHMSSSYALSPFSVDKTSFHMKRLLKFFTILGKIYIQSICCAFTLLQKLDEAAAQSVFLKSLENYIKWCDYLCIQPVWSKYGPIPDLTPFLIVPWFSYCCKLCYRKEFDDRDSLNKSFLCSLEAVTKEKKLLFVSLYFLIWGESGNIRFLPECLCYIFHHVS